jgi:hypothetical protein
MDDPTNNWRAIGITAKCPYPLQDHCRSDGNLVAGLLKITSRWLHPNSSTCESLRSDGVIKADNEKEGGCDRKTALYSGPTFLWLGLNWRR